MRFYHRTSANHAYSNGVIVECLRVAWPWLIVALFVSAVIGTLRGHTDSLIVGLAMAAGAWGSWAWKRR